MCFIREISPHYACKGEPPHAGSNLRIYVNTPMLQKQYPLQEKAQCILHELNHVLLETVDKKACGKQIYGRKSCSLLAILEPIQAQIIADAWGYFLIDCLARPEDLLGPKGLGCSIL